MDLVNEMLEDKDLMVSLEEWISMLRLVIQRRG